MASSRVRGPHLTRRGRWLQRRRRHRRVRPAPLRVRVANCASVSTGAARSRDTFERALTTPTNRWVRRGVLRRRVLESTGLLPDVVLAMECADFDAEDIAGPGWRPIQRGDLGSPESAIVGVVRRNRASVTDVHLEPGVGATSEGGGIRRRPVLTFDMVIDDDTPSQWTMPAAVGHAHPARAPRARAAYLRVMAGLRGVTQAADWNLPMRLVARAIGRRVQGIGVLGIAVPRWIPTGPVTPVEHGSDHPGVDVTLWPTKEER